jgi:hypothetical protein
MRAKEITQLAQERGYYELHGATLDATISAAIETEMKRKGETSRFAKADKGLFVVNSSQTAFNCLRMFYYSMYVETTI